jgi:VWFA-related protein
MSKRFLWIWALGALGAAWVHASGPGRYQPPAPSTLVPDEEIRIDFELDVLLVEFDVSVLDRRGGFVSGLSLGDFRLFEDGREVPISVFEELVQKSSALPAGAEPGSATGRSFLVFVDTYLAGTRKVMQVRRALVEFLEKRLAPGDTLSVAVLEPYGQLEVATGLGRDDAVQYARGITPPGGRFATPSRNSYWQARHVLGQLQEAVQLVLGSSDPAPRSLIFLSPGFVPVEPEEPLGAQDITDIVRGVAPPGVAPPRSRFDPRDPTSPDARRFRGNVGPVRGTDRAEDQPSIEALMGSVAGWLSARNITLYSINCGDRGPLDLFGPPDWMDASLSGPPSSSFSPLSIAESQKLNMLRDLAELTGGLAWLSTRSYGQAFRQIDAATATVYRIGFRPDTQRQRGRYHNLKVVVDRKKVKVRHPRGYLDS